MKIISTLVPPDLSEYLPYVIPTLYLLMVWLFSTAGDVTALHSWFTDQYGLYIPVPGKEIRAAEQSWKRMRRVTKDPRRRARLPDFTHWL